MIKLLSKIWSSIKPKTRAEREYEWLSNSKDLVDLERRQRQLQIGKRSFL